MKYWPKNRGIGRDFSDEAPVDFVGHDTAYVGICLVDVADVVVIWKVAKWREESLFENYLVFELQDEEGKYLVAQQTT